MINSNAYNYIDVLSKAADASWKRNEIITNNLANNDTPGYKRKDVSFQNYPCVPEDDPASTDPPDCMREAGLTWSEGIKHGCVQGCGSQAAMTLKANASKPTSNHSSAIHRLGKPLA